MKTSHLTTLFGAALVLAVVLSGCTSVSSLTENAIGSLVGGGDDGITSTAAASGGSGDSDEGSGESPFGGTDGTEDSLLTEQAFLSRESTGEWWYISLSDGEYLIEYECFIGPDDVVTEVVYRDSDMAQSNTAVVNVPLDRMSEDEEYPSIYDEIEAGETEGYQVTRTTESVTVPAGTFDAERITVVGTDEDGTYIGELRRHGTDYRRLL